MAATIVSRTISAIEDKRITIANDQIGRVMTIGSNWTRLRVAARLSVNPSGSTDSLVGNTFQFGLCSGTSAMIGDATTTNFLGVGTSTTSAPTWNYNANAGDPTYGGVPLYPQKRVGSTLTQGNNIAVNGNYFTGSVASKRMCFALEITKDSPSYTCEIIYAYATNPDLSYTTFITGFESATMLGFKNFIVINAYSLESQTLAFDEVAGALDTINIRWSSASRPLEISEVVYARLA